MTNSIPWSDYFGKVRDVTAAQVLLDEFHEDQIKWGLREYRQQTPYLSGDDFVEWMRRSKPSIPDRWIAKARLINDPTINGLVEELETLRGAWFPDADTLKEIEALEERLQGALS